MYTRSNLNPILKPNPNNWWEAKKLYSPGAIYHDGNFHLFYRAVGEGEDWKSSIGYAVSSDGEKFERFAEPVLTGEIENEKRGLEDPRITKIGNTFYMVYAAFDGITPRLSIATSDDLKIWSKHGPAFSDWNFSKAGGTYINFKNDKPVIIEKTTEWSKSGGIFPEKINGKFLMLFGECNIWFAESDDGIHWQGDKKPFLSSRPELFDNTYVEMGPPPIKTDKGWLVIYHGIDDKMVYRLGFLMLDLKNPRNIIYRSEKPIFEPTAEYELNGIIDLTHDDKPKVVFCCGAVLTNDLLRIFYGAGDQYVCTASISLDEILSKIG